MCGKRIGHPTAWEFSVGKRRGQKMIEVDAETGCWIWMGTRTGGYGQITYKVADYPGLKIGRRKDHRTGWRAIMAHQLMYFIEFGNPPVGTELGHTCNRRSCCNPRHVRPITQVQNAVEMYRMPELSADTRAAIEEAIEDDLPHNKISDDFSISVWSVRKISNEIRWRAQYQLRLDSEPLPF